MSRIKGKDTSPELFVRRLIYSMGYRYRIHCSELPGKPDIVFKSRKKVIFVHGCFWHQHENCKISKTPKSNSEYWIPKLRRNKERDFEVQQKIKDKGWEIFVIWECEIYDPDLPVRIQRFLVGK